MYDEQTVVLSRDIVMNADFFSPAHEIAAFQCGAIQFDWSGANMTAARVVPQVSIDGIDYCDYISEADCKRIDKPAGCGMYEFQQFSFKFVRISFLVRTNTTGVITIRSFAKRVLRSWG